MSTLETAPPAIRAEAGRWPLLLEEAPLGVNMP